MYPPNTMMKNLQQERAEAAVRDRYAAFHLLHCVLLYAVYGKMRVMRSGRRERCDLCAVHCVPQFSLMRRVPHC